DLEKGLGVLNASVLAGFVQSTGEARRQIKGGGIKVNDDPVTNERQLLTPSDLTPDGVIKLSLGKKRHALIRPVYIYCGGGGTKLPLNCWDGGMYSPPDDAAAASGTEPVKSKICRKIPGVIAEMGFTSTSGSSRLPLMAKVMPTHTPPWRPTKTLPRMGIAPSAEFSP